MFSTRKKESLGDIPYRPLLSCSRTDKRIIQPCVVDVVCNSECDASDEEAHHQRGSGPMTAIFSRSIMIYACRSVLAEATMYFWKDNCTCIFWRSYAQVFLRQKSHGLPGSYLKAIICDRIEKLMSYEASTTFESLLVLILAAIGGQPRTVCCIWWQTIIRWRAHMTGCKGSIVKLGQGCDCVV